MDWAQTSRPLFKQFVLGKPLQWTCAFICGPSNLGRVFAITTSGTVLNSFSFNGTDGANPVNGLIQTADGTLYGTATKRGTTSSGGAASGVIYTISGLPPNR